MVLPRNEGLEALMGARRAGGPVKAACRTTRSQSAAHRVAAFLYAHSRDLKFRDGEIVECSDGAHASSVKIVCVSDTHNVLLDTVPDGDVLIHAGDLTGTGSLRELQLTVDWLRSLPHRHKFVSAGNHDTELAEDGGPSKLDWGGVVYLQDEARTIDIRGRKLKVYGSPWTPRFGNFCFQYPRHLGDAYWQKIPSDVDVLITHGPPKGHRDFPVNAGCASLGQACWRVRPKVHVFGHIHAGRGIERLEWDGAQSLWERVVMRALATWMWLEVVKLAVGMVCTWMMVALGLRRPERTYAINAAVVGGASDELKRPAIALSI